MPIRLQALGENMIRILLDAVGYCARVVVIIFTP